MWWLLLRLNNDRGSVGEHLGYALHDFGGVVTSTNDRIRAQLRCMFNHDLKSFAAGALAELSKQANVAAHQSLQTGADRPDDRTRTHSDATHDTEVLRRTIVVHLKRSG